MGNSLTTLPAQREFMESLAPELLYSGAFGAGKSRIGCEKGLFFSLKYPNNVGAIIRKNFAHLRYSTMETFFRYVCPEGLITKFDKNTSTLTLPNNSKILFLGIDQPQKVGSLELGWVFVDEAVECDEDDWTMLLGRLRLPDVPFYQIFGATNPGPPTHFLYKRFFEDKVGHLIQANSLENTYLPESYRKRLDTFTGRYRERYVEGKWVGFEGLVYSNFDPIKHIIEPFPIPNSWEHYRVVDFGYTNPACVQWWARAPKESRSGDGNKSASEDKRPWYMYQEIYASHLTVEELAELIKRSTKANTIVTFADWDAGDRAILEGHGIPTTKARKAISLGIQEVYNLIDNDEVYFFRDALIKIDTELKDKGKATCTTAEFPLYRWLEGRKGRNFSEEPLDKDNHGMDAMRYLLFSLATSQQVGSIFGGRSSKKTGVYNAEKALPRDWRSVRDAGKWGEVS